MKKTQEFSGKDVDTAVKTACDTLSVSKKDLKYEVISTGASGIFGIVGRKDAVIKVVLPQNNADTSEKELEGIRSMVDEAFGSNTRISTPSAEDLSDRSVSDSSQGNPPLRPRTTDTCSEKERTPNRLPPTSEAAPENRLLKIQNRLPRTITLWILLEKPPHPNRPR